MKIILRSVGLDASATWQDLVVEQLHRLKSLTDIESAEVILKKQADSAPACRVRVLLAVPGLDFHSEATYHTLAVALHKAVENLARKIRARKNKRVERRKSRLQLNTIPSRCSGALVGHQALNQIQPKTRMSGNKN